MKILGFIGQVGSVLTSVVGGALTLINNMLASGMRTAMQYHEESIALARSVGMSYEQSVAYSNVLVDRAIELGKRYGITADAVKEIQRGIIDATGKQYMLNEAEAERQVQINKLVGAGTANQFTEQMMNHMGAQLSTVQGAVSKAYATAAKSGLNAAKFSKEVAKNLSLANKLSFRDGVNGIIRMTALSEKLGFNLQSVENAANKFMDLDSAIESSAQLQMLGGAAGAYGSNPLTMAYEANYDPEAFTERMTKMLGGYAQFDRKTGMANVNGMNRDFVKNIASAMGISMDEAMSIAKKQAEIKYKEGAYSTELGKISKENRDAVLNRSYVDTDTGHLMINDVSGKAHDITKNGLDESILKELQQFDNMSEKEIMQRQAETLTSINDKIQGIWTTLGGHLAKIFEKHMPDIQNFVDRIGDSLIKAMPKITDALDKLLDDLLKPENLEKIEKFVDEAANNIAAFLASGIKFFDKTVSFLEGIENKAALILGALIGYFGYKGIKNPSNAKGNVGNSAKNGASPKSTNTPNSGASTKPSRGAPNGGAPNGGAAPKPGDKVTRGGQEYRYTRNGEWVDKHGNKPGPSKQGKLTETFKNKGNGASAATSQATKSTTTPPPSNSVSSTSAAKPTIGKNVLKGFKGGARGSAPVAAIIAGVEGYMAHSEYEKSKEDILNSNTSIGEKSKRLSEAKLKKDKSYGSAIGGAAGGILGGALAGAATGAAAGTVVPGIGNAVGLVAGLVVGGIGAWLGSKGGEKVAEAVSSSVDESDVKKMLKTENHDIGGIVGGNSYSGDRILTGLNSGEMVLNKDQQAQLFKFISNASNILTKVGSSNGVTYYNASNKYSNLISSYDTSRISSILDNRSIREKHSAIHNNVGGNILSNILSTIFNSNSNVVSSALNTNNNIKTIPFGENSFRKIPKSDYTEYSYNKGGEITVKDINLNVNGTLKLDAGTVTKNLDINQLLSDTTFISSLKDLIKQSINNDMNGGRFMNDNATLRGSLGTTTYWGR